jgi:hypothetical protein
MIVGQGNYLYRSGRGNNRACSKMSKVCIIRGRPNYSSGVIDIRGIHFPKHCIGKRVRIKVEFVDEPNMVLDKHRNLVEVLKWDGE